MRIFFAVNHEVHTPGARVVEWQTRMFEGHVGQPVGVRVPPRAPFSKSLHLQGFSYSSDNSATMKSSNFMLRP